MAQDPTSALAPGSTVGEWRLLRKLGEGAMGVVFEAVGRNGKNAALKVIRPDLLARSDHAARFRREGKLLRKLEHRNVVRLLDLGEADGFPFIALSFIEGESLAQRLERGPLTPDEAMRFAKDLFRGLAAIHDAGIMHRDLKPGNVLLAKDGDWKITDFGLARRESEESIVVTRLGAILGTPHYMSPEQCLGEPTDMRSDVYSAGATIFHAVSGEPPFRGKAVMDVMRGHISEKPPDLAAKVPGLPPELPSLVARLLSKTREDRPESARAALLFLGSPDLGQALPVATAPARVEPAVPRPGPTTARMTPPTAMPRTVAAASLSQVVNQPASFSPASGPTTNASGTNPSPPGTPSTRPGTGTRRFAPLPATTPTRDAIAPSARASMPRPTEARRVMTLETGPTTQRLALTPSGRVPGVVKANVVRRGRRIPWERATLPLLPAIGGTLTYLVQRVLARDDAFDPSISVPTIKQWALIGLGLGLFRVFTGFFEVNAPPLAKNRWFYTRFLKRARAILLKTAKPRSAAQALRDLGDFTGAAAVLLAAGFDREAGAELLRAGEVAAAAKIFERVNDAQAAVKAYSKLGDNRAAVIALEAKRFDEAARLFTKYRAFDQAADAWQRAGKPLEAANAFEAASRLEDAGNEIARALENPDGVAAQLSPEERHKYALRAADLFERAGAALGAAGRFEKLQELEVAQQLFEHGGDLAEAARLASLRGDHEKAAELFTRAGRSHEAAKERGLSMLARGGFSLTGTGSGSLDQPAMLSAARSFEAASEPRRAADLFAQAGDFASAGRLYGQAGAWKDAALCYRELGDKEAANRALEQADPLAAAETWAMAGKPQEALRILSGLTTTAARGPRAAALLGDVHRQTGHKSEAVEAYVAAIEGATASDPEIQHQLGHYADALVGLGKLDRAIEQLTLARRRIGDSPELDRVLQTLNVKQRTGKGGKELIGCVVDRYRVASVLGEGATAWVYKAEHTFLGRAVALKVLKPNPMGGDTDIADRFYIEAQAVAKLKHRNVIHVFDVGSTPGGLLYMALELVNGDGLRQRMEKNLRLAPAQAVRIAQGVLSALSAAHALGIVHRDLKPENILLAGNDQPKVVDFGIAKLAVSKIATLTGTFLGTPKYASPEQSMGLEATASSDLYAAGLVLFEMLAGRSPFESETPLGFLTKHATTKPMPLADLVSGLPPALVAAVMRSLEKDPQKRWPDAESFRRALAPFATGPAAPKPPPRLLPRKVAPPGLSPEFGAKDNTVALPGAIERMRMAATGIDLDQVDEEGNDETTVDDPPREEADSEERGE